MNEVKSMNEVKYPGVHYWNPGKCYRADIYVYGKKKHLGYGRNPEELHRIREEYKSKHPEILKEEQESEKYRRSYYAIKSNRSKPATGVSGHRGVKKVSRCDKWQAYIQFRQKYYHLGTYDTVAEAVSAREAAEAKLQDNFMAWFEENFPHYRR